MAVIPFKVTACLILITFTNLPLLSSLNADGLALLALKAAITTDPTDTLASWSETDPTPCHWHGITCINDRVTSLSLPDKNFTGYIPSELGLLGSLTRLTLSSNNFSKSIPSHLLNATALRFLDLSQNSLSGLIPANIVSLQALTHLDLSSNCLNGSLPASLSKLKSLTGTLNLSYNSFSGEIPGSYGFFPVTVSLDLRHNNLSGKVPLFGSLVNQGPTAFAGNPSLCGFPLQTPCPEAVNITVSNNPENPKDPNPFLFPRSVEKVKVKTGSVAVPIISGFSVVIGVVSVSLWLYRKKRRADEGKMGKEEKIEKGDSNEVTFNEEEQKGKFVVMDEGFNLELEDLLRASAYVVGKSRSGMVYKVVVGRGGTGTAMPAVVAVRRLSEGDAPWKLKEFESEVDAIGRVHHPNIVKLRAYYFAHDEKLLVSDFIRNGSLDSALHGEPSNNLPLLSWAARLKIAQGTARGLMYIHEHSPRKYVHGNLKSSKILLGDELQPYISSFGLARLVSNSSKLTTSASKKQYLNQTISSATSLNISTPSNNYLAPEARVSGSKFSQKCDVYSFGIVLMELLTGRLPGAGPENDGKGLESLVRKMFREERPMSEIIDPALLSEVHAKKQVIAVFHISLNCTELDPELRPRMRTVSESLDRIKLH
ncbi:LEUCINE-RICH REPEAT RECEPTOR-LIKE PROTEIN KINASE PXC1 [Salix purpurea]|uniref:LEUCINE-RICH REPEAT RECEPTOR-LIKE PROTEIN KINASE PXC1 n=1 Tax=Salix purpurea TaxID=77065 RepID=A0A9Q0VWL9_SALPP|nr:LEUCINE-RICH REPEAT RECEPTOR-LIKE PROTEIN KINASE PXC1 [Salix purpurea]